MTVSITVALLASAAVWHFCGHSLNPANPVVRPLQGFNIFIAGDLARQRNALNTYLAENGGQLASQLNVETDLVVTGSNSPALAGTLATALSLHIPVLDFAHLPQFARAVAARQNAS
jgi:NAD-dependent DNA ligase